MSIEALKAALDAGPVAQALSFSSGYVSLVPFDAARLSPLEPRDLYAVDVGTIRALLADALRYRQIRRGQRLSVINGIGDELRADALDAAIDAAMQQPPAP